MYRAMIFDFDGTLAELNIDFRLMKRQLLALGQNFDLEPADSGTHSLAVLELLDELAGRVADIHGRDTGLEFHTRGRFLIQTMEMNAARQGRLFAFTRGLLEGLGRAGVATGIVTRNTTAAVRVVFPDAERLAGCLLGREDTARPKPHPDHVRAALDRLGAAPAHTLMVGDHPMDIAAGHAAGTHAAAVFSGSNGPGEFADVSCDHQAPDAHRLAADLAGQGLLPPVT
jgi:phosphoglycolate phosphatase